MKNIYLALMVLVYSSSFINAAPVYKDTMSQLTLKEPRNNFTYAIVGDTAAILPAVGLGYRAQINSYFAADLSLTTTIPVMRDSLLFSDSRALALYYPVKQGFYLGIGGGWAPSNYLSKNRTPVVSGNRATPLLTRINRLNRYPIVEFGRFAIGYEWRRNIEGQTMFIQASGVFPPSISVGIGF